MDAHRALELRDAYLDRALDPQTAAEIDRHLAENPETRAAFESQRDFNALLKRRAAAVPMPADFNARLRRSFGPAPMPVLRRPFFRRWSTWGVMLAAGVALAAGLAMYFSSTAECVYLLNCTKEHSALTANGGMDVESGDVAKLAEFVGTKTHSKLTTVPTLPDQKLMPVGASVAHFEGLKDYGAPDAVAIAYRSPTKESVSLIVHNWPDEEPAWFTKLEYKGQEFWAGTHGGKSVASWKGKDGNTLMSTVSTRSKDETLALAYAMRSQLN